MKKAPLSLVYLLFILFNTSCESGEDSIAEECKSLNKNVTIMPLGASRVQGFLPYHESYRYELWKKLVDQEFGVDFVGGQEDLPIYDNYKNYCFDDDHEGHSGWTSVQINEQIENWLDKIDTPDIVLFSSPGGNDALNGAVIDEILPTINAIIDKIQMHNPNVTILIEQMAPGTSSFMTPELILALEQMHAEIAKIASDQTSATSEVIVVDMATGFSDDFFADYIHYNNEGAQFVATRYYDALIPYLKK